ncbi:hypothetical protein VB735_28020 [Halotia wernerae UHCC 0503]|nr:hypothetical protein [Halotia wernerae UHCC 0503]
MSTMVTELAEVRATPTPCRECNQIVERTFAFEERHEALIQQARGAYFGQIWIRF